MKAKKRKLTAVTLSAFLVLAAAVQAQDTGGDKATETGKKPGKIHTYTRKSHKSGKKGHKGGKKGHKGGKKSKKGNSGTNAPPPKQSAARHFRFRNQFQLTRAALPDG